MVAVARSALARARSAPAVAAAASAVLTAISSFLGGLGGYGHLGVRDLLLGLGRGDLDLGAGHLRPGPEGEEACQHGHDAQQDRRSGAGPDEALAVGHGALALVDEGLGLGTDHQRGALLVEDVQQGLADQGLGALIGVHLLIQHVLQVIGRGQGVHELGEAGLVGLVGEVDELQLLHPDGQVGDRFHQYRKDRLLQAAGDRAFVHDPFGFDGVGREDHDHGLGVAQRLQDGAAPALAAADLAIDPELATLGAQVVGELEGKFGIFFGITNEQMAGHRGGSRSFSTSNSRVIQYRGERMAEANSGTGGMVYNPA